MGNRPHIHHLLLDPQGNYQVNRSHHLHQYLFHSWNNRHHQRLRLVNQDTCLERVHWEQIRQANLNLEKNSTQDCSSCLRIHRHLSHSIESHHQGTCLYPNYLPIHLHRQSNLSQEHQDRKFRIPLDRNQHSLHSGYLQSHHRLDRTTEFHQVGMHHPLVLSLDRYLDRLCKYSFQSSHRHLDLDLIDFHPNNQQSQQDSLLGFQGSCRHYRQLHLHLNLVGIRHNRMHRYRYQ